MTSSATGRGLIMVVEDEPAIADMIRLNFAKAGYGVHWERDAAVPNSHDMSRRLMRSLSRPRTALSAARASRVALWS